jgi:hypothetical protein
LVVARGDGDALAESAASRRLRRAELKAAPLDVLWEICHITCVIRIRSRPIRAIGNDMVGRTSYSGEVPPRPIV